MEIKTYQKEIDNWIKEFGVRYFDVKTNTILLMEELGEFSRLVARLHGEQSFKSKIDEQKAKENLKEEIADIYFVLTCLANQLEVDLESVVLENLKKKTTRDKDRHKNNPKLQ